MPDQSSAASEHAIIQEITAPLETLPEDPLAVVNADFPVALRGYDRIAVDAYVKQTSQLVAELQATRSPEAAILYSVDAMATRGATGLTLQPHWRMMGALEAANGMLLFGISTAFIFTVMQFYYQHLLFRASPDNSTKTE